MAICGLSSWLWSKPQHIMTSKASPRNSYFFRLGLPVHASNRLIPSEFNPSEVKAEVKARYHPLGSKASNALRRPGVPLGCQQPGPAGRWKASVRTRAAAFGAGAGAPGLVAENLVSGVCVIPSKYPEK